MSHSIYLNPLTHSVRFAEEYADRLEHQVEGRMHALEIPEAQIGSSDLLRGVPWQTFFPHESDGGGVVTGGQISVDSGVLNPELLTETYGRQAGTLWAKSRLRDRIDAINIHEFAESQAGTHEEALLFGLRTDRKISEAARRILNAMEQGWRS